MFVFVLVFYVFVGFDIIVVFVEELNNFLKDVFVVIIFIIGKFMLFYL